PFPEIREEALIKLDRLLGQKSGNDPFLTTLISRSIDQRAMNDLRNPYSSAAMGTALRDLPSPIPVTEIPEPAPTIVPVLAESPPEVPEVRSPSQKMIALLASTEPDSSGKLLRKLCRTTLTPNTRLDNGKTVFECAIHAAIADPTCLPLIQKTLMLVLAGGTLPISDPSLDDFKNATGFDIKRMMPTDSTYRLFMAHLVNRSDGAPLDRVRLNNVNIKLSNTENLFRRETVELLVRDPEVPESVKASLRRSEAATLAVNTAQFLEEPAASQLSHLIQTLPSDGSFINVGSIGTRDHAVTATITKHEGQTILTICNRGDVGTDSETDAIFKSYVVSEDHLPGLLITLAKESTRFTTMDQVYAMVSTQGQPVEVSVPKSIH
ncbi:hypothetical protein EBR96_10495, partial [bacterium]|nr:hypothetical protein [bacterium]